MPSLFKKEAGFSTQAKRSGRLAGRRMELLKKALGVSPQALPSAAHLIPSAAYSERCGPRCRGPGLDGQDGQDWKCGMISWAKVLREASEPVGSTSST